MGHVCLKMANINREASRHPTAAHAQTSTHMLAQQPTSPPVWLEACVDLRTCVLHCHAIQVCAGAASSRRGVWHLIYRQQTHSKQQDRRETATKHRHKPFNENEYVKTLTPEPAVGCSIVIYLSGFLYVAANLPM